MNSLTHLLGKHHKHCDELFVRAESSALGGRWPEAIADVAGFRGDLEAHLAAEESLLFPAFEAATGMSGGPTQVMRLEHGQMRELLAQLESAVGNRDVESFSGAAETLLVLMQQHNMKEENILYPMCDGSLGARTTELIGRLQQALERPCSA